MQGTSVGPYVLDSQIGAGGMGTVWLAARGAERVALKVIHPHLAGAADARARFLREADIGRRVRHPNVVATLDAGADDRDGAPLLWLAMEYVEGQTLRALLAELGRVPEELCRHVGREAARGLDAIHAAGAIHRDLKPDNVLITRDHVVKLMDLGVARIVGDDRALTATGTFVGSIQYAAPEQFVGGGRSVDARADLHALGVVLYELATGVHPFAADDVPATVRRVLAETPRRAGELNPQLSAFFEEAVQRLVAKSPGDRFGSADEIGRVLETGEGGDWWRRRSAELRAATTRPLRRMRIARETALVGRDAELGLLRSLFDRASAGDAGFVLVEGEAGIGKSRLVDEFAGRLAERGEEFHFLHGSWPAGGAATGAAAFVEAFREHFGRDGLDAGAARCLADVPRLAPAFAALLRGDAAPAGEEALGRDSLLTVFVHACRALAAERPTVLFLDDLGNAPAEGRAILAAVVHAAPSRRLLVVAAAAPGAADAWFAQIEALPHVARLRLARLPDADLGRMLSAVLRPRSAMDELPGEVARKAGGNPFFAFEILRGLREAGLVETGADGVLVRKWDTRTVEIPSTLRDMTQARLAGLAPEDRDALDVASCCGDAFDPFLVGEVLGTARIPLLRQFGRIEKQHRLVRSAGASYEFDHAHVREALYSALSELLRREYHEALGAAVAARCAGGVDGPRAVEVCGHLLRGTQPAAAMRHLDAALTHLGRTGAHAAAADLAALALSVPGVLTGGARISALFEQARRFDQMGRRDDERCVIDELVPLTEALGDPAASVRLRRVVGWHMCCTARYDEARTELERAIDEARALADRGAEAHATRLLGITFSYLGRFDESRVLYERAAGIARETGDRDEEAAATINLGIDTFTLGRFEEARAIAERGLELAREAGNRRWEINATASMLNASHMLGRMEEALETARLHLRLSRESGYRRGETTGLGNVGDVLLVLGDARQALEHFEGATALARELGDPRTASLHQIQLGLAREQLGDAAGAERIYRDALAVLRRTRSTRDVGQAALFLGALIARDGRAAEAAALLDEARKAGEETDSPDVFVTATLRAALLPGGDVAAAIRAFATYESRLETGTRMQARHLLHLATHDRAHRTEARRLLDHLVAHAPADRREAMLRDVRLHREIVAAA